MFTRSEFIHSVYLLHLQKLFTYEKIFLSSFLFSTVVITSTFDRFHQKPSVMSSNEARNPPNSTLSASKLHSDQYYIQSDMYIYSSRHREIESDNKRRRDNEQRKNSDVGMIKLLVYQSHVVGERLEIGRHQSKKR